MKTELQLGFAASILVLTLGLAACGGGTVSSGAAADIDTADIAGVYRGTEMLALRRDGDGAVVDRQENVVEITIDSEGTLLYTNDNGSRGEAFITNDSGFAMRADARTHFGGACSTGTLVLSGQVGDNTVSGRYSSRGLTCDGRTLTLSGRLTAGR